MLVHDGFPPRWSCRLKFAAPEFELAPEVAEEWADPTLDCAPEVAWPFTTFPWDDELAWPNANELLFAWELPPNDEWPRLKAFESEPEIPESPAAKELDWLAEIPDLKKTICIQKNVYKLFLIKMQDLASKTPYGVSNFLNRMSDSLIYWERLFFTSHYVKRHSQLLFSGLINNTRHVRYTTVDRVTKTIFFNE